MKSTYGSAPNQAHCQEHCTSMHAELCARCAHGVCLVTFARDHQQHVNASASSDCCPPISSNKAQHACCRLTVFFAAPAAFTGLLSAPFLALSANYCSRTPGWAPSRFMMVRSIYWLVWRSCWREASPCHTSCCCTAVMSAGYTASQLFGAGVSYTYDDVIMHPGHISFGAHEVRGIGSCVGQQLLIAAAAQSSCCCSMPCPPSCSMSSLSTPSSAQRYMSTCSSA